MISGEFKENAWKLKHLLVLLNYIYNVKSEESKKKVFRICNFH